MHELALFAGAGGGILGGILCGHTCIGAVEIEEYPRKVLLARQRDGILPRFPIWDDICTFRSDNSECSEYFDFLRSIAGELVISGGFPCQDISSAGKGAGIGGSRSGLWSEMARIIGEIRPARVFVENSPLLVSRGLTTVLGDLAEMGYDARWCVLGADNAGAPHKRKRIWLLANSRSQGLQRQSGSSGQERKDSNGYRGSSSISWWNQDPADLADTSQECWPRREYLKTDRCSGHQEGATPQVLPEQGNKCSSNSKETGPTQPFVGRVVDGCPERVHRLKALGNMQVPGVVALAWKTLTGGTL